MDLNLDLELDFELDLDLEIDLGTDLELESNEVYDLKSKISNYILEYGNKKLEVSVTKDYNQAKKYNKELVETYVGEETLYLLPQGLPIRNSKLFSKFVFNGEVEETEDNLKYKEGDFDYLIIKNHLLYITA